MFMMKKYSLVLLLFILGAAADKACAQVTISGKILLKKQPVPGASITLKDTYDGTTSDSSGNFRFSTSEKGEHTLVITAVGFKPYEQKVSLSNQPVTLEISMKEE